MKQYRQFGLAPGIPLFGSGFLTEGGVLTAQGDAALGVHTALHYTSELTTPRNTEFVQAYQGKYGGAVPTVYSVQTWGAATVLDRALRASGGVDGDSISKALGGLGPVDDSPRGTWSFANQTPMQKFYLRPPPISASPRRRWRCSGSSSVVPASCGAPVSGRLW